MIQAWGALLHWGLIPVLLWIGLTGCKPSVQSDEQATLMKIPIEFTLDCRDEDKSVNHRVGTIVSKKLIISTGPREFFYSYSFESNSAAEHNLYLERFQIPLNKVVISGTAKKMHVKIPNVRMTRRQNGKFSHLSLHDVKIDLSNNRISVTVADNAVRHQIDNCVVRYFSKSG